MSYVIIRGANMRRHEVNFSDDEISVSLHTGSETVELMFESCLEESPEARRRYALVNIRCQLFSRAITDLAKTTRAR